MLKLFWAIALVAPLVAILPNANAQEASPSPQPSPSSSSAPSNSHQAECNRLIAIANQAVTEIQSAAQAADPNDLEAYERMSNIADRASAAMNVIELSDSQLDGFRQRFISMYTESEQAIRNMAAARRESDSARLSEAYNALVTATSQEEPLVNDVNTYCTPQPQ